MHLCLNNITYQCVKEGVSTPMGCVGNFKDATAQVEMQMTE
jgi:hypothetical protein